MAWKVQNLIHREFYEREMIIFMPVIDHLNTDSEKNIPGCTFSGSFTFCLQ